MLYKWFFFSYLFIHLVEFITFTSQDFHIGLDLWNTRKSYNFLVNCKQILYHCIFNCFLKLNKGSLLICLTNIITIVCTNTSTINVLFKILQYNLWNKEYLSHVSLKLVEKLPHLIPLPGQLGNLSFVWQTLKHSNTLPEDILPIKHATESSN